MNDRRGGALAVPAAMLNLTPRFLRVLACLLSAFTFATAAHASPITVTFDSRRIAGTAEVSPTVLPYADFASGSPWVSSDGRTVGTPGSFAHSDASQTSTIDAPTMTGSGTGLIAGMSSGDPIYGDALSYYSVTFDLSEAFTFSWTASLSAQFDPGLGPQLGVGSHAEATAFLYDLIANTYVEQLNVTADASTPAALNAASATGLLLPGSYVLFGRAYDVARSAFNTDVTGTTFAGNSSFDVSLTLTAATPTAVPEPTTLALVGCGVVAAAARRRRSRR